MTTLDEELFIDESEVCEEDGVRPGREGFEKMLEMEDSVVVWVCDVLETVKSSV